MHFMKTISIVLILLLVAATIVLSSTAGAAEWHGSKLGEFVEAGEHGGRPFYTQRDTEGVSNTFLYSEGGKWWVSDILGESAGFLRNKQDIPLPATGTWEHWDGEKWRNDDTSLTLTFTTLSPCKMVRVTGRGDVVEKQLESLGDYRSVNITTAISQSASGTNSFVFWIHPTSSFSCGPG